MKNLYNGMNRITLALSVILFFLMSAGNVSAQCVDNPGIVQVTNSSCSGSAHVNGTIMAPLLSDCIGNLQYSTDGLNWTLAIPAYDQLKPMIIYTRCYCGVDSVSTASSVETIPGGLDCIGCHFENSAGDTICPPDITLNINTFGNCVFNSAMLQDTVRNYWKGLGYKLEGGGANCDIDMAIISNDGVAATTYVYGSTINNVYPYHVTGLGVQECTFNVTIENIAPEIAECNLTSPLDTIIVTLNGAGIGSYDFTASDFDGDDEMIDWTITKGGSFPTAAVASANSSTATIDFSCANNDICEQAGVFPVLLEVVDKCGNQDSCTVYFKVIAPFSIITTPVDAVAGACNQTYDWRNVFVVEDACGNTLSNTADLEFRVIQGRATGHPYVYGTTTYEIEVIEKCSGLSQIVSWEITRDNLESGPMGCNNLVQISLDDKCEIGVNADMILEGDWQCYDGFAVILEDVATGTLLADDTIRWPGTYKVTISDPFSGNSCWGKIIAEDKVAPTLSCDDIIVDCSNDLTPGAPIIKKVKQTSTGVPATITDNDGACAAPGTMNITFSMPDVPNDAIIMDVNVHVYISHQAVRDLDIELLVPASAMTMPALPSTSLMLVDMPGSFGGTCLNDNFDVFFDDDALFSNSELESNMACGTQDPSIDGSYKPAQALSLLNGRNATGTWTLSVCDAFNGNTGTIDSFSIEFFLNTGTISFPVPIADLASAIATADNEFTILHQNHCDAIKLIYTDTDSTYECTKEYDVFGNGMEMRYLKKIKREWRAEDASGNVAVCTQDIYIKPKDFTHLIWPPNWDNIENRAFNCSTNPITIYDEHGYPDPSLTGMPYDWSAVDSSFCDNVQKVYSDLEIPICTGAYKIIRTWTLLDWCTGEIIKHDQLIKVEPAPLINTGAANKFRVLGIVDGYNCTRDYTVNPSDIFNANSFSCNGDVTWVGGIVRLDETLDPTMRNGEPVSCREPGFETVYQNTTADFTYVNDTTIIIKDLVLGCNWVRLEGTNDCGITQVGFLEIAVVDSVPPIAVCDQFTVVSLGIGEGAGQGEAWVYAETFDDGSWDNCSEIEMYARRMSGRCPGFTSTLAGKSIRVNGIRYYEKISFCCADVTSNDLMVEFLVRDASGNTNTCMVNVTVQDKLPPIIICPPTVEYDCDDNFEALVDAQSKLIEFYDNCGKATLTYKIEDRDKCNNGQVIVTWYAEDKAGLKSQCNQRYVPKEGTTFDGDRDIRWPRDIGPEEPNDMCEYNTDPSKLGDGFNYPSYKHDGCSLLAATNKDIVFKFVDDACLKILRKWTVIDWCQYEENGDTNGNGKIDGIWYHTQIIKILNTVTPEFTSSCQDTVYCGYGSDCTGSVTLSAGATDDCTPTEELNWKWEIDIDYDVSNAFEVNMSGAGNNVTRTFSYGTHKVRWYVEDGCGNVEKCERLFTLKDCKAPTPYCISNVTTVVMPSTRSVEIWAKDFDLGSTDNCTGDNELIFSFSPNKNSSNYFKTFTCDDIPNGVSKLIQLRMYVRDQADNVDFCTVTLDLQDNGDGCTDNPNGGGANVGVQGRIQAENSEMMSGVQVSVESEGQAEYPIVAETNASGGFAFGELNTGYIYEVESTKNDNALNGVSTLDIILIQRHILGIDELDSPYKLIAADTDNNSKISTSDIVALRKLILGISNEFGNDQKSWRFIDKSQEFANPENPFPFIEKIILSGLNNDISNVDFMGIKIGDVNGSTKANSASSSVEGRSHRMLSFFTSVKEMNTGEIVEVPVYADNFEEIMGFQYTLGFDNTSLMFQDVESGSLDMSLANFGTATAANGMVTVSWNDIDVRSFDNEDVLFTLRFKALKSTTIEKSLRLNSALTRAEAYSSDLEVFNTELNFRGNGAAPAIAFNLYQNNPNPFGDNTVIGFDLPEDADAKLTVYDVSGRIIKVVTDHYAKGFNEIKLSKSDLGVVGVMYYTLETSRYTATQKMVGLR